MKKILPIVLLFVFFLFSCAPNATPNVTATSVVTATSTLAPTFTPTITVTATETPDPNKPLDATGQNAQGNYIKVENGVTVVWDAKLNTWERHLNVNDQGIPLLVASETWVSNFGFTSEAFLHVNISDKVPGFDKIESISLHPGITADYTPGDPMNLTVLFDSNLIQTYHLKNLRDEKNLSIPFTTLEGPQTWIVGPNTNVIVDILEAPVGNGFFKTHGLGVYDGIDGPGQTRYQLRIFADSQGNLHEWIVPSKSVDKLTKEQLLEMYLYAPAYLTQFSDFRTDQFCTNLGAYILLLTKPAYPHLIDFGPPQ